jgi:hypothetical protein
VGDFIVAVGLEGLVEAGLIEGTRVGLVGLVVEGRLEGGLEALVGLLTAIPYECRGIIECKHIGKYSTCSIAKYYLKIILIYIY